MQNHILTADYPAWYGLSYDNGVIRVTIPQDVYDYLIEQVAPDNTMRQRFVEEFATRENNSQLELSMDINRWPYGISNSVTWSQQNACVEISAELPVVFSASADSEAKVFWGSVFQVSASLAILFQLLRLYNQASLQSKPQLLTIENLRVERGLWGSSLSDVISPALTGWLSQFSDNYDHPGIKEAMLSAHQRMAGPVKYHREWDFRVLMRKPYWINLSVPGNACGLDPSDYFAKEGRGFELLPHNTDSPIQQLSMIAALAKMYQLAREAGF